MLFCYLLHSSSSRSQHSSISSSRDQAAPVPAVRTECHHHLRHPVDTRKLTVAEVVMLEQAAAVQLRYRTVYKAVF